MKLMIHPMALRLSSRLLLEIALLLTEARCPSPSTPSPRRPPESPRFGASNVGGARRSSPAARNAGFGETSHVPHNWDDIKMDSFVFQ